MLTIICLIGLAIVLPISHYMVFIADDSDVDLSDEEYMRRKNRKKGK